MQLRATTLTLEDRPISVAFGDMPTPGALLGGIAGIDKACGDALSQGLVFHKTLKGSKAPTVDLPIALPAKVGPTPDMGQLLKDNNGAIICGGMTHQPLTDLVQCFPVEAVLPTAKPFKSSLSAPGAFALKGTPHPEVVVPSPIELSSLEELVCRGNSNVLNPQIDPNNLAGGKGRWDELLQHKMQVKGLISIDEVSGAKLPGFVLKIASLIIPKGKFTPYSMPIGREGAVVGFDSAGSGIIADGSEGEVGLGTFSLDATFHRLSHFVSGATSEIRREIKYLSGLVVDFMVEDNLIGESLLPSNLRNPVAGIGVCLHRLKEKATILGEKLYPDRSSYLPHIHILVQYRQFVKEGGMCQFLCRLKSDSLLDTTFYDKSVSYANVNDTERQYGLCG